MSRVFTLILGALLLSMAWAAELPDDARLTLVNESGVVVGVGVMVGGNLTLTLEAGAAGFITILVEGSDGTTVSWEGLVTAAGQVLVTAEGVVEDLVAATAAAGGEVTVEVAGHIAPDVDVATLPEPAADGIVGAIAGHDEGDEGDEGAGVGADVDVDVDVEIGVDAADDDAGVGINVGAGVGVGVGAGKP